MSQKDKENKKRFEAAALKYDAENDDVPYIVALGKGLVAEQIIETAIENKVKVVKDEKLSSVLGRLGVGDEIPEELYAVVAEILVFVSSMDEEYKSRFGL